MRKLFITAAASLVAAGAAYADADLEKGEKDFKKCKSCHMIANGDDVIYKGGKTGPNLYGVVGRVVGSVEGFKYSKSLIAVGEAGTTWDAESMAAFVMDPKGAIKEMTGDGGAKTKMTFKLKDPTNVIAYLASVGPAMEEEGEEASE